MIRQAEVFLGRRLIIHELHSAHRESLELHWEY